MANATKTTARKPAAKKVAEVKKPKVLTKQKDGSVKDTTDFMSEQTALRMEAMQYQPFLIQRVLEGMCRQDGVEGTNAEFASNLAKELVNEEPVELYELMLDSLGVLPEREKMAFLRGFSKGMAYEYVSSRRIQDQREAAAAGEYRSAGGYNFNQPDPLQVNEETGEIYANAPSMGEPGYVPSVSLVETAVMELYVDLSLVYVECEKVEYAFQPSRRTGVMPFGFKVLNAGTTFLPIETLEDAYQYAEQRRIAAQEQSVLQRKVVLGNVRELIAQRRAEAQAKYAKTA